MHSAPTTESDSSAGASMATSTSMEFEKPIAELERQIDELKKTAGKRQLSMTDEIAPLERKLDELRAAVYKSLTPLQRVQVARNARRPFTLDYLQYAFTDFIELHGDRLYREDAAIVGGWARKGGGGGRHPPKPCSRGAPSGCRSSQRSPEGAAGGGRPRPAGPTAC